MRDAQNGLLFDLIGGCFESGLESLIEFRTFFEIRFCVGVLAAH